MNRYVSFAIICSLFGAGVACGTDDVVVGETPPLPDPGPQFNPPDHRVDIDDLLSDLDKIVDQLPDPDGGVDVDVSELDSGSDSTSQDLDSGSTDDSDTPDALTDDDVVSIEDSGSQADSSADFDGGSTEVPPVQDSGSTGQQDSSVPPVDRCVSHGYKNYGKCVSACAHRCLGSQSRSDGQDCFKPCKATCCQ